MTTRHYYRCHRSPRHRGARLLMVILSGFAISCFTADLLAALATGNPARLALQPAEAPPAIAEVVDPEPEKEKEGCHPPPRFLPGPLPGRSAGTLHKSCRFRHPLHPRWPHAPFNLPFTPLSCEATVHPLTARTTHHLPNTVPDPLYDIRQRQFSWRAGV
jgi:hypothetical protein